MGGFTEVVLPGFFDDLEERDVVAMLEHLPQYPLAAEKNGSLTIDINEKGVQYSFEASDTTYSEDLLKNVRSGLIDQSSFGFVPFKGERGEEWERKGTKLVRYLKRAKVWFDVSPVTHAAFPDTTVALRSYEKFLAERKSKSYHWIDMDLKLKKYKEKHLKI